MFQTKPTIILLMFKRQCKEFLHKIYQIEFVSNSQENSFKQNSIKYFVQLSLTGCQVSLPLPPPAGGLPDDYPPVPQGPQRPVTGVSQVPKETRSSIRVTQVAAVIRNDPDRNSAGCFIIISSEQSGTPQVRKSKNTSLPPARIAERDYFLPKMI